MALQANALTTVAQAELMMSDLTAAAQDDELEMFIDAASDAIDEYVGHSLYYLAAEVEKVAGAGDAFLFVDRTPIVSISEIKWLGDDSIISSGDYEIWDAGAGSIYKSSGWNDAKISQVDFQRYQVTFAGGFVTPPQGGTQTLPRSVEMVCLDMVVRMFRRIGADQGVKSESILGTSITYADAGGGILSIVSAPVLDQYRRIDSLTKAM
jgi:hypothetical protein|tara:strand:- start:185 stop:811 length:627 start_codon:yes stop_codon:yes gene_type:complete